jgi:hypothetical protein
VVEQEAGDGQRVVAGLRPIEARVAEMEQRRPASAPAGLAGGVRPRRQQPTHLVDFAAHDRREQVGARQPRTRRQHALRREVARAMRGLSVVVAIPARELQERVGVGRQGRFVGRPALRALPEDARGSVSIGGHRPLERPLVGRRQDPAGPRSAAGVLTERPVERARIAIEDRGHAVATIEGNRVEDVDVRVEQDVAHGRVAGVVGPSHRRRAVLRVADSRVRAMPQQRTDGVQVAVKRGGVERRVRLGVVHRHVTIGLKADPGAGGNQPVDDVPGRPAAGVENELRPGVTVPDGIRVSGEQPGHIVGSIEPDGARQAELGARGEQLIGHRTLAVECGLVERREPGGVLDLHVSAQFQQRGQGDRLAFHHGKVKGLAPEVGPIHWRVQVGSGGREGAKRSDIADGNRGKDRVARPVSEEVLDDIGAARPEARGPSDDLQLVPVAVPNRIRAVLEEQPDHRKVLVLGGEVQRKGVVALVADVRVGAPFQQQPHDGFVRHAKMQCRSDAGVPVEEAALADERRVFVEERRDFRDPARGGRGEEGRQPIRRRRAGLPLHEVGPAAGPALASERLLHLSQRGDAGYVRIDAIEAGPGVAVAGLECLEPAPGALPQVVDGGQETPSFRCTWCPLASGRKKVRLSVEPVWVGVGSLAADRRRPSARCR